MEAITERSSSLLNADNLLSPTSTATPLQDNDKGTPLPPTNAQQEGEEEQPSLYDITLQVSGNMERRFPVDRRKLERLIIGWFIE